MAAAAVATSASAAPQAAAEPLLKLYTAWFCPFAQRAWFAALYKDVAFEYIETDPYAKTPEWLAINPRGLVPTFVDDRGRSITESMVCVEYLQDAYPDQGPAIVPSDAFARAAARIWTDFVSKKLTPLFYRVLMKEGDEQSEAATAFVKNLAEFYDAFDAKGPFFAGDELGLVDVAWAPFAQRFYLLEHYKGFKLPADRSWERHDRWWAAISALPAFQKTIADKDKLIAVYERYATNTAKSEVADAIRKGQALP